MFNHKLFATRGLHPTYRTTFSIATRGFSFGAIVEYGIRLLSYIKSVFSADAPVSATVELESKIP